MNCLQWDVWYVMPGIYFLAGDIKTIYVQINILCPWCKLGINDACICVSAGREFYKLTAWTLTQYDRVMMLDSDLQFIGNVDHLLQCTADVFLASPGFQSPLNGGMWVLRPSLTTYYDMVKMLTGSTAHAYTNELHWGNLGLQRYHVGAEGPQGFMLYYFFILPATSSLSKVLTRAGSDHAAELATARGRGVYVDKCVYNSNLLFCNANNLLPARMFIVHKPVTLLMPTVRTTLQRCRPPLPGVWRMGACPHIAPCGCHGNSGGTNASIGAHHRHTRTVAFLAGRSAAEVDLACTLAAGVAGDGSLSATAITTVLGRSGTGHGNSTGERGKIEAPPPVMGPGRVGLLVGDSFATLYAAAGGYAWTDRDTWRASDIVIPSPVRDDDVSGPAREYLVLVHHPYDYVVDAILRRDEGALGATGTFALLVRNGTATIEDYIAFSPQDAVLNPQTSRLASVPRIRKTTK